MVVGCQPHAPAAFTPRDIPLGTLYGPLILHKLTATVHGTVMNAFKFNVPPSRVAFEIKTS
jgi:hypothetical protein